MRPTHKQRGFTLLELMIAISIFALVGLGTYRMLDAVMKADAVTRANEQALRELTRAIGVLDRDIQQIVARPVRDAYGDHRAAVYFDIHAGDGVAVVEFTRTGWRNPTGMVRSQLQRVRWRLAGDTLERVYWTVLDQAADSQGRVQKILGDVESMQWRYLDAKGQWQTQWPVSLDSKDEPETLLSVLPTAIELQLEHRRFGELKRLYRLPDSTPEPDKDVKKRESGDGDVPPDDEEKPDEEQVS